MPIKRIHPLGLAVTLAAGILACRLQGPQLGGPQPPAEAPVPSADGLQSFTDKWRSLNLSTPTGPFSVTFTEGELTSALADAIASAESEYGEDIPLSDPRVVLRDGQIFLYARIELDVAQANGLITAVPVIGMNGLVDIQVTSVEYGPLEIDPHLIDELIAHVEQSINAPIQASPLTISLSSITISGGQMTIAGTILP